MRKCKKCEQELDDLVFTKPNGDFFKLCPECRENGRIQNNRRKEAKSAQAKEYYQQYKEEVSKRNKEYRKKNKAKLQAYDKSLERKTFRKRWLQKKRQEDPCRFIYYSAKKRSKDMNLAFNITKQDIIDIYPKDSKCPMLGIKMHPNVGKMKDNSPSLDRLVPERGYVKDNVVVISYKANRIKNDATLQELKNVVLFLESLVEL